MNFALAKDSNGQLFFPQLGANGAANANAMNSTSGASADLTAGLNLPNPTQINFAQENQQQQQAQQVPVPAPATGAAAGEPQSQQQQQQQLLASQQQAAFALFQQQMQQAQANAQAQANGGQPAQQPQQQQPLLLAPQVVQQQQIQPQQAQQPQAQQQQQIPQIQQVQQVQQQLQQQAVAQQFSITGDANAFLRQLQIAQIQQQFNALQQQQQQGGIAQSSLGTAQQQAALQQQLQQLQRGQMPMVAVPPVQQQQQPPQHQQIIPPVASAPISAAALPPMAKPPATTNAAATKTKVASRKRAPPAAPTAMGIVSASDTDGEFSSRALRKKSLTGPSKKRKPPEPIDTSNMTPGERAKANRDRNREHARNTRLRKKAYLEKLKTTVDELCKERDTLVSERAGAANLLVEMHNTRTEVLMSFFALRSTNEKRRKLWSSILDESCFACVMPVTPYRSFPASEVQVSKCQRTVLGIDGMMADTASLHVLLSSLVDRSKCPNGKIEFCYTLVTEEAVVAGNQMMARWVMSTVNAVQCGARMEVAKQGMLCCKFNSAHRITGLEVMFDVMALMLQLKQAAGSESFSVIPNTVQTCQRSFDKPMVMTLAEGPYTIVQVNQLWESMSGYKAEDVVGKTSCGVLQGPLTDKAALQELMNEVRFKRSASIMLINYNKSGERFRNHIIVFPLSTDSRITHYLALTTYIEKLDGDGSECGSAIAQPQRIASTNGFNATVPQQNGTVAMAPQQIPVAANGNSNVASGGQMQQLLQGNGNVSQDQVALANAASAALMAQNGTAAAGGQMLPPSATGSTAQQQQQLQQAFVTATAVQQAQV